MTTFHAVQAAEHWHMTSLHKGMAGFARAVHLKHVGQQILANFVSRQLRGAWNAWTDLVQVKQKVLNGARLTPCLAQSHSLIQVYMHDMLLVTVHVLLFSLQRRLRWHLADGPHRLLQ